MITIGRPEGYLKNMNYKLMLNKPQNVNFRK